MISGGMHALVPCMAMGIPVIAAFDNLSYRFFLAFNISLYIRKIISLKLTGILTKSIWIMQKST